MKTWVIIPYEHMHAKCCMIYDDAYQRNGPILMEYYSRNIMLSVPARTDHEGHFSGLSSPVKNHPDKWLGKFDYWTILGPTGSRDMVTRMLTHCFLGNWKNIIRYLIIYILNPFHFTGSWVEIITAINTLRHQLILSSLYASWTWSSLNQIMACDLLCAKLSSATLLAWY